MSKAFDMNRVCFEQQVASIDDFLRLRVSAGLTARPRAAAEKGLPNSLYGVTAYCNGQAVGMARVVGDGGLNFEIVDVAVEPAYQARGIGAELMRYIGAYLDSNAPKGAYITLIADQPEFYQKFGFVLSRPDSEGMYKIAD